jgi:hypothetical protein
MDGVEFKTGLKLLDQTNRIKLIKKGLAHSQQEPLLQNFLQMYKKDYLSELEQVC